MNGLVCILLVTSLTLIIGDTDVCRQSTESGECIDNVEELNRNTETPVDFWHKLNLDTGCTKLRSTRACTKKFWECQDIKRDFINAKWEITELILKHICGSGHDEFKLSSNCSLSSAVATGTNNCARNDQDARKSSNYDQCQADNNVIKCYVNEFTKAKCNKESVTYMKFFQLHRRKPDAVKINCTLEYDDGDWDDDGTKDGGSKMSAALLPLLLLVPAILLQF